MDCICADLGAAPASGVPQLYGLWRFESERYNSSVAKAETEPRIRTYLARDFPEIHRIDQICFARDIAYSRAELLFYVRDPGAIVRVAELGGAVAGFVVGRVEAAHAAHVLTLDVLPEARRRKVGTALISALHAELERRGIRVVVLEVDAKNEGAQRFYEGFDYRRIETLKGYYNGRSDALRMVRGAAAPLNAERGL